jgi:hypothetical protein
MQFEDPSLLLDALSQRVLRHLSVSAWRNLFLRPVEEVMQFSPLTGTLLCAAAQVPAWAPSAGAVRDLEFLAHSHGGELDPCPQASALVRFETAQDALAMAIELQQMTAEVRYQVGLATGECTLVTLMLEGNPLPVLVGGVVDRVEAVTRQATSGSIRLAPETFAQLQDAIARIPGCMVATEYQGEEITATSLTLAPRANAFLSTFAGLGMT